MGKKDNRTPWWKSNPLTPPQPPEWNLMEEIKKVQKELDANLLSQKQNMGNLNSNNPLYNSSGKPIPNSAIGSLNGNFSGFNQPWYPDPMIIDEPLKLVVFYGFSGTLAQRFSIVEGMSVEEITARMMTTADKVPWKIMEHSAFKLIEEQFIGTPNAMHEIPFEDALSVLRAGMPIKEESFEEAEVEEFDDNCTADCRPANHHCGKEK